MTVVLFTIREKQDGTSVAADSPQIRLLSPSVRLLGFTLTSHVVFIVWGKKQAFTLYVVVIYKHNMKNNCLRVYKAVSKPFVTDLVRA